MPSAKRICEFLGAYRVHNIWKVAEKSRGQIIAVETGVSVEASWALGRLTMMIGSVGCPLDQGQSR